MQKKKKLLTKIIVLLVVIIIALGGVVGYGYLQLKKKNVENMDLLTEIENNTQTIYVASRNIQAGEIITDQGDNANVQRQTNLIGLEPYNFITEDYLGCEAVLDIDYGYPILVNMVSEISLGNDTREYEICTAIPMTTQSDYDYVDLRIVFPNGEDFIVLSQKQVNYLDLENCIFTTYMNEEEILRYSSACIDAYTISGTKLYTTRYVEKNVQDAATPTYYVRQETIDLMNSDPNIVTLAQTTLNREARSNLESRMTMLTKEHLEAVTKGNDLNDTASSSVIMSNKNEDVVDEDITGIREEGESDNETVYEQESIESNE